MKRIIGMTLFSLSVVLAFGQSSKYFLDFYLPVQPEVNAYFNLLRYLDGYNKNANGDIKADDMSKLIDLSLKYNNLQSYLIEAFFRSTTNTKAQSFYTRYLKEKKVETNNTDTVQAFFQRTEIRNKDGSRKYQLANGKFAEDIDLFDQDEETFFDKKLHSQLFGNSYNVLTMKQDPTMVTYMCGGGTNSFSAMYRYYSLTKDDFIKQIEGKSFYKDRYSNWRQEELPIAGVLKLSNADQMAIGFGSRNDEFGNKEGEAVLYLYSEKYKQGYEIAWMMNFSNINIFFDNPERIWNYMCELMLFTWID